MFTNKRQLKKYIERLGNEIAQSVLPAAVSANVIAEDKAEEMLDELSRLQAEAHSRLNIVFDKAEKDFANPKEYAKERRAYFKAAYGKALAEYEKGIDAIIDAVNKAAK